MRCSLNLTHDSTSGIRIVAGLGCPTYTVLFNCESDPLMQHSLAIIQFFVFSNTGR